MSYQSIIRPSLRCVLFAAFLFANGIKGQTPGQNEFSLASSRITQQTNNTYRLIRIGSNHAPLILIFNHSNTSKAIPIENRNNTDAVRNFANLEAQDICTKILTLPGNASLTERGTFKSGNLWLSSYSIAYNGISLRERFLRLDIGALSGEVMMVRNSIPSKKPNSLSPNVDKDEIIRQSINLLGTHTAFKSYPHLIFIDKKENSSLRLCYEVMASDPDMNDMWRLTFDAQTGDLIEKKSLLEHDYFSGAGIQDFTQYHNNNLIQPIEYESPISGISGSVKALVHLHTPFDSLTTVGLPYAQLTVNGVKIETDSNGFWSLASGSYPLTIQTSFNSRFFSVLRQDLKPNSQLTTNSPDILWDNSNSDPSERDAFYSAAFAHLADKRLDEKLTDLDFHMKVNVNLNSVCNAYYIPSDTSINFFNAGSGCTNTAQISDVIFHEYGHRVTNAIFQQQTGLDANIVDGSLSEGFADLNSAFIRDDPRIGVGFFGNNSQIIRSCANTKKWPRDINQDIHISGEIISGAFWDLRKTIGHDEAEHLFHFMEYQMPDGIGVTDSASLEDAFTNTLTAAIITDDDDNNLSNGTPHLTQILDAFALHNITLSRYIDLSIAKIQDQDTAATSYPVKVTASFSGLVGAIDNKSVKVFYSTDKGLTFDPVMLNSIGNDQFVGAIPKVPVGTEVKYYASATSTLSESNIVQNPLPSAPLSFLVGYRQILFDDAESEKGWSLSSSSDRATTGLWVRDKPHGTFTNTTPPIYYIQQDTDHTPYPGTMCYITGNHIDPSGTSDPNFAGFDDVDNGSTTLTTPAYDLSALSSPIIRYWYYYSNNQGQNPGVPKWQTDISNDNGISWKSLQLTNQSSDGWVQFAFRVNTYLTPTSSVKIRFIASDNVQALVEAGVDDFEILDPITQETNLVNNISKPLAPCYPNPIHRGEKLHIAAIGNHLVKLTDLLGRILLSSDISNASFTIPIEISPGIYFIEEAGQRTKIAIEP